MLEVPDRLRSKAYALGLGRTWLADLPSVCRRLADRWSLDLGRPLAASHVSMVVAGTRAGQPVVLKVPIPSRVELGTLAGAARADEAHGLRAWAGDGAVRLLEYDEPTEAMLIERCVPGATLDSLNDPELADSVAAELLDRLHQSPSPAVSAGRLDELAADLAGQLPYRFEAAGQPFEPWLLNSAVDLLVELSRPGRPGVMLHGDFHHDNVLAATRQPWLIIDPLPMIGDPAYDAVQYLLFAKGDLADPADEWGTAIDRFCARAGLDPERVKAWTFARLVSDAIAAAIEGTPLAELEARQGDLWTARLVHRLRG